MNHSLKMCHYEFVSFKSFNVIFLIWGHFHCQDNIQKCLSKGTFELKYQFRNVMKLKVLRLAKSRIWTTRQHFQNTHNRAHRLLSLVIHGIVHINFQHAKIIAVGNFLDESTFSMFRCNVHVTFLGTGL